MAGYIITEEDALERHCGVKLLTTTVDMPGPSTASLVTQECPICGALHISALTGKGMKKVNPVNPV